MPHDRMAPTPSSPALFLRRAFSSVPCFLYLPMHQLPWPSPSPLAPSVVIGAQGPLHPDYHGPDTCGDFWHAVVANGVGTIVALAKVRPCIGFWLKRAVRTALALSTTRMLCSGSVRCVGQPWVHGGGGGSGHCHQKGAEGS